MNKYIIIIAFLAFISCQHRTSEKSVVEASDSSKLERFLTLPKDSVYLHCDLSGDSIAEFPDLSEYTIRSLDLTFNQIKKVNAQFLPNGLERLNVSHNQLEYLVDLKKEVCPIDRLEEINVSYNRDLRGVTLEIPTKRIYASHCNLKLVSTHNPIELLDISYNPRMSNVVDFRPEQIKTLIHDHIANNEPMYHIFEYQQLLKAKQKKKKRRWIDSSEYEHELKWEKQKERKQ